MPWRRSIFKLTADHISACVFIHFMVFRLAKISQGLGIFHPAQIFFRKSNRRFYGQKICNLNNILNRRWPRIFLGPGNQLDLWILQYFVVIVYLCIKTVKHYKLTDVWTGSKYVFYKSKSLSTHVSACYVKQNLGNNQACNHIGDGRVFEKIRQKLGHFF